MAESIQHKLGRVRPPRVQITYDVETLGAIEMKELPFVVGILADLSGKPEEALPLLKERKFVEIDRDNLNDIMDSIEPRLAMRVDNTIADDGTQLNVELKFHHMDDFEPVAVVKQVPALRKLYEARQKLSDLLTKLDGNDELDRLLGEVVENTDGLNEMKSARPADEGDGEGGEEEGGEG